MLNAAMNGIKSMEMEIESDLDLIVIGKTGNGKSAVGNSIIGEDVFRSSYNTTSITKYPDYAVTEFEGRIIQIVDCPGVLDTDIDETSGKTLVKNALQNAILANPRGYHAFLVVVKFGNRYTKEEQEAIAMLKDLLGNDCLRKYGIVVLTNGDTFEHNIVKKGKTLEDYSAEQVGPFKELLRECENRILVFNNITDDQNMRIEQVRNLIHKVDQLNNNGERYTNDTFQRAQRAYQEVFGVEEKPTIDKHMLTVQSLFILKIKAVQPENINKETAIIVSNIRVKLLQFLENLELKDKNISGLKKIIENLTQLIIHTGNLLDFHLKMIYSGEELIENKTNLNPLVVSCSDECLKSDDLEQTLEGGDEISETHTKELPLTPKIDTDKENIVECKNTQDGLILQSSIHDIQPELNNIAQEHQFPPKTRSKTMDVLRISNEFNSSLDPNVLIRERLEIEKRFNDIKREFDSSIFRKIYLSVKDIWSVNTTLRIKSNEKRNPSYNSGLDCCCIQCLGSYAIFWMLFFFKRNFLSLLFRKRI